MAASFLCPLQPLIIASTRIAVYAPHRWQPVVRHVSPVIELVSLPNQSYAASLASEPRRLPRLGRSCDRVSRFFEALCGLDGGHPMDRRLHSQSYRELRTAARLALDLDRAAKNFGEPLDHM